MGEMKCAISITANLDALPMGSFLGIISGGAIGAYCALSYVPEKLKASPVRYLVPFPLGVPLALLLRNANELSFWPSFLLATALGSLAGRELPSDIERPRHGFGKVFNSAEKGAENEPCN